MPFWQLSVKTQKRLPSQSNTRQRRCPDFSSCLQFLLERSQFFPRCFEFVTLPDEQCHQTHQTYPREIKYLPHRRIERSTGKDNRLRMLRTPPPDRTIDEWHIEKRKHSKERAHNSLPVGVFNHRAQDEESYIEQPQNKSRSQPRIPRPPDSPGRMRPDRPREQNYGAKRDAHFGRRNREPIPIRLPRE